MGAKIYLYDICAKAIKRASKRTQRSSSSGYRQTSIDEAIAMMKDEKDYIILDVRGPDEYAEGQKKGRRL